MGGSSCQGLLVHTTLASTSERMPLGLLAQQVWARDPHDVGKRARRKHLPIRQKESQKWLHSLDAVLTAHDCCPTTRLVLPCSVVLDLDEWQALSCAIPQYPTPPKEPPSLSQAVHWIAQLGGFVGRHRGDQSGPETLWRGLQSCLAPG